MGLKFGNLYFIRNIVYYRLSPYELKALGNFWANSIRGLKRDYGNNAPYFLPPILIGYFAATWAKKENARISRKQPGQFDHET